jgi:hypothetical protein
MSSPQGAASSRSETADAITVIIIGVLGAVAVIVTAIFRAVGTFRPDGVAWTLNVDDTPAEATVGSGAVTVRGYVEQLMVIVPDLNAVSSFAIGASIAVWACTALIVIASVMFVAWSFLRGRFFVSATARAFGVIGWSIVLGTGVVMALDTLGGNGVLAAVGAGDLGQVRPTELWAYAPAFAIGVSVGIVAVAFRRGVRLQRETDLLV